MGVCGGFYLFDRMFDMFYLGVLRSVDRVLVGVWFLGFDLSSRHCWACVGGVCCIYLLPELFMGEGATWPRVL